METRRDMRERMERGRGGKNRGRGGGRRRENRLWDDAELYPPGLHVGIVLQQKLHHVLVSRVRRMKQRRPTLLVSRLQLSSLLETYHLL